MNVLITGGAGYLGTELLKKLVEVDHINSIKIYDNLARSNYNLFLNNLISQKKIEFVRGDILDTRTLKKHIDGIDTVYHLAAKVTTPFSNEDTHSVEQINRWGSAELSYAIESSNVKNLIYASSCSVYGVESKDILNIQSRPNPVTNYGKTKFEAEKYLERLSEKLDVYTLRVGNVFGYSPSMRFDSVINKFCFNAHFSKRIQIHGNGSQYRPFAHVDYVAKVLAEILNSPVNPGKYNLVTGNHSVLEIAGALKEIDPQLEMIFADQSANFRSLKVEPCETIRKNWALTDEDPLQKLQNELKHLKSQFSF